MEFYYLIFIGKSKGLTRKSNEKKDNKKTITKKENIDEILKQPGEKTNYVPTKFGAMKIMYKNYLFTHHYSRNRIARYRCESFDKSKCSATIIVVNSQTYPGCSIEHNHSHPKY